MKKILTVLIMVFGLSSMLHAVAYDAKIAGCENNTQLVEFSVDDGGWYYVSIPFDTSFESRWYLLTTFSPLQISARGGDSRSFFVVTDYETGTPIVGRCL